MTAGSAGLDILAKMTTRADSPACTAEEVGSRFTCGQ
jgi:hypothetical protein